MADAILSVVAERFFSIIENNIWEEVNLVRGFDKEVDNLSKKLKKTRHMLDDAEKQNGLARTKSASASLKELEDASYELEDVLDEWYMALRNFQVEQQQNSNPDAHHVPDPDSHNKVCNYTSFISCSCFPKLAVRRDIAKKLQKVKKKIDSILAEKDQFVLVPTETPHSSANDWRVQTTLFVDMTAIYGRDIEREDLVRRVTLALLQPGDQPNHLRVLSIVGVGGVGKTTLAQLVYNDSRVIDCFELRIWICVSDPFDEVRVAKNIIEGVTKESPDSNQLEVLLQHLKECISGKKFLLVMDDVWTEDSSRWTPLITCLKNGSIGSKVLVTTRNERVAKRMGSLQDGIHHLRELSDEACWLLLQRIALSGRDEGEWKRFESIGMKIANKCKGLPLAAKALGSLLHFKNRLEEWENVLNSEIWELENLEKEEDKIFPHLHLSYNELSPTLKRCFSYCAIFPKDTMINVEILIEQWMAVGYLGSDGRGTGVMEHRGRDYFDKLAMRSLFQDFKKDDLDGQIKYCKMHDIVHDFAQSLRKNGDAEVGIRNTSTCEACSSLLFSRAKEYRSIYFVKEEPRLPQCNCLANLRVVSLIGEHGKKWKMIPPRIERFIHLRRLDMRWNDLDANDLKSICRLYNLQTLLLSDCNLKEITREIGNLIHLRHLNLTGNESLKELPREIGSLIHLRHLNLSGNGSLKELPESVCDLHVLQRLNIDNCWRIHRLPQGFHRLENLKHLHIKYNSSLEQFPQGVAQLTGLYTLNEFCAVSGKSKLGWLKNLNRLSGSLRLVVKLSDLENIVEDAKEGELKKKDGIQNLDIKFEGTLDGDQDWVSLLDALEFHPNLVKLQIHSYGGSTLPSWMALPDLNKLMSIHLDSFSELLSLPPLGRLPCLVNISIQRLQKMEVVGPEFLGTNNSSSTIACPKLRSLTFVGCNNWREWEDITTTQEEAAADSSCEASSSVIMPRLTKLNIYSCKRLKALPHRLLVSLSSLEKLDIRGSTALEILYGERKGSAWKSISDVYPSLRLRYSFCFDSNRPGLVTTSHVELPAEIYGGDITVKRDDLVGRMVDQTNHLQILSIFGPYGVGKTTLAQLVYNDSRVRECFELRIWIRTSVPYDGDTFDMVSIAKAIIGSVTKKCLVSDKWEVIVRCLKECISGKKFLLVMDGVRMAELIYKNVRMAGSSFSKWEALITLLKKWSIGSKVLVTTQEESSAKMMGSLEDEIYHIRGQGEAISVMR